MRRALITGLLLLAARPVAYAFQPYGGPQGAGAVFRLKF